MNEYGKLREFVLECRTIRRKYVDIHHVQQKKHFYHEKLNHVETDKFITFWAEFTK